MQTIKDLLNKIKWDEHEDPEEYELFYLDRIENSLKRIKYSEAHIEDNIIEIKNEEGKTVLIPLHRIRYVKKKGILIWERRI